MIGPNSQLFIERLFEIDASVLFMISDNSWYMLAAVFVLSAGYIAATYTDYFNALNRFFAWFATLIFAFNVMTTAIAKVCKKPLNPYGCVLSILNDVHMTSSLAMISAVFHAIMCMSGSWVSSAQWQPMILLGIAAILAYGFISFFSVRSIGHHLNSKQSQFLYTWFSWFALVLASSHAFAKCFQDKTLRFDELYLPESSFVVGSLGYLACLAWLIGHMLECIGCAKRSKTMISEDMTALEHRSWLQPDTMEFFDTRID